MDVPSILIVDDTADKRLALEAILRDLNARIVTVRSGEEALRRLLVEDFAVILLDVRMPGLDGFETAAMIRRRPRCERTPIIFITAFADELHVARGYALKAVDYILPPVVGDVLRTKVSVLLDLYRMTAEAKEQAAAVAHRAEQLHRLSTASLTVNAALSIDQMLTVAAQSARDLLRVERAVATVHID